MEDASDNPVINRAAVLYRAMRPAVPAVIGAAALTFLFAAFMPMSWVMGISWNLYLDRLSDLFAPPVGNGGRLALALAMASLAAIIAGFVALLIAQPAPVRRRARGSEDEGALEPVPPRRRADLHPDDPPRPPIRAGRDLPAEGLGPILPPAADDLDVVADELVLADLAPAEPEEPADAPWLQPAELAGPPMPDPADNSLGAMVARFEAGLGRRRQAQAAVADIPIPAQDDPAGVNGEADVDFALEAALGTLQRMNRQAVG